MFIVSVLLVLKKSASASDIPEKNVICTLLRSTAWRLLRSAAWRSGVERRFYDDHDRKVNGSTPNLVSLLRHWIRCFTVINSAWWNLASSKLKQVRRKFNRKTWKQGQLLSESGFFLRIAPPPLSRDRRIKMKKSINQSTK